MALQAIVLDAGRKRGMFEHACFLRISEDKRPIELYDLNADIGETNNLATSNPDVTDDMLKRLRNWTSHTNAQLSIDTSTGQSIAIP